MAKVTQKQLLNSIKGSGGIVSVIARKLGIDWHTARKMIDNNPHALQAWHNEREGILDLAESALVKSIQNGDTQDAKWLLSRLGKARGYAERVELDDVSEWRRKVVEGLINKTITLEAVKASFDPATALDLFREAGIPVNEDATA